MTVPVLLEFPIVKLPLPLKTPPNVSEFEEFEATVPPLPLANVMGLETVMLAVESKVPPARVTVPVGLFKLAGSEIDITPEAMVVPPEYVFEPDRTVVPTPTCVSVVELPLIDPDSVILPVEPTALELAIAILPLSVAAVALELYKAAPNTPVPFKVR